MEPKIQKITHNESQSSSAAAQMIASIDDHLIQIFLRLPMKSLVRFKLVSKHWQSLINDPGFGVLRNPNPNPSTGLILQVTQSLISDPYAYIVSFDDTYPQIRTLKLIDSWPRYDTTRIKSSCNGLILTYRSYEDLEIRYDDYYVCNLTTNKYFKLPQIHVQPERMLQPMCLAFDPCKSSQYKIVCVLLIEQEPSGTRYHQFLVYSSETGCWKKSCVEPFQAASVHFERGVYWNGAMHWVSYTKSGKSIYFDPDEDRMSLEIMPTPPSLNNNHNRLRRNSYYYFGESCGHLHYINNSWNRRFDVYELRRDYSEWFVKFRINLDDPCSSVDRPLPCLCAVVRGKSHDDDSFSVLLMGGKFVRYNILNKTRETICEVEGSPLEQYYPSVYLPLQHAESLCFV